MKNNQSKIRSNSSILEELKDLVDKKNELQHTNKTSTMQYKLIIENIDFLTNKLSEADLNKIDKLNNQEIENLTSFIKSSFVLSQNKYINNKLDINKAVKEIIESRQNIFQQAKTIGR